LISSLSAFGSLGFSFLAGGIAWLADQVASFHLEGMARVRRLQEKEREGEKMSKWIACGSVTNPKRAGNYIRFSSKVDWQTEEEALNEAKIWEEDQFIWVEKVG
jgi:hypothetical protein